MRGPIDYIIVGFEGEKYNGSILKAIEDAIEKNIIALVAIRFISKNSSGEVVSLDISNSDGKYLSDFSNKYSTNDDLISSDDIEEVSDLLEDNTSAGLLIVEQLWAIPLKQALIDANGVLVAEGRIHPDAAEEINEGGK